MQRFPIGPLVVVSGTDGLEQFVGERSRAEAVQRRHGVRSQEAHQPPRRAGEHADAREAAALHVGQRVRHAPVPRVVAAVEELHAPRVSAPAQPAELLPALPGNARVGDAQLPVGLASHLHLPVVAALPEAVEAHGVEGGVEAGHVLRDLLPGFRVGDRVAPRRDDEFWMGRVGVEDNICGICVETEPRKTCVIRVR